MGGPARCPPRNCAANTAVPVTGCPQSGVGAGERRPSRHGTGPPRAEPHRPAVLSRAAIGVGPARAWWRRSAGLDSLPAPRTCNPAALRLEG